MKPSLITPEVEMKKQKSFVWYLAEVVDPVSKGGFVKIPQST
jgi:hypothetical protein